MFESLTGEQLPKQDKCVAWDDNAIQYLAKGYSVVPLAPKQKGPKIQGWTRFCETLMTPDEAQAFCNKNNNIGLALGPASGVCAVDIDTDDPEIIKQIEKLIPDSPVKKRGAKGYTAFYKFNGAPSKSVKSLDGQSGVDFLSAGRQTVLPPSIHPSGMEYCWLTQQTLLTIDKSTLPELTGTALDQLLALFRPKTHIEKKQIELPRVEVERNYIETNIETAKEALNFIDPDQSYDTWIQVGLALQEGFGPVTGCELFVDWSARGMKFDGAREESDYDEEEARPAPAVPRLQAMAIPSQHSVSGQGTALSQHPASAQSAVSPQNSAAGQGAASPQHPDAASVEAFRSSAKRAQLLFVIEQYIGKPLAPSEVESVYYISEQLHFSDALIDYLLQYCIDRGKKDFRYIQKVAVNWAEHGITTPKQAERAVSSFGRNRRGASGVKPSANPFNQFEQNQYDFDELEKEILGN